MNEAPHGMAVRSFFVGIGDPLGKPGCFEQKAGILQLYDQHMKPTIELERKIDGRWIAEVPELPGCASAGMTPEEALDNIREAIELYLQKDPLVLPPNAVVREVAA